MVQLREGDGDTRAASPSPDDSVDIALHDAVMFPNWDEVQDDSVLGMHSHDADALADMDKDDEVNRVGTGTSLE